MARIEGVDPDRVEKRIGAVLEAQAKKWGSPGTPFRYKRENCL